MEKTNPAQLGVMEQTGVYHTACDELRLTVDVFSGSALSAESTRLDAQRDRAYSAFKSYVKVYFNDDDGEKSEAAERIITVVRNTERELGHPLLLGLAKESTVLLSLLRNLDPLAADIARIGATGRLKNLENANQAYADLQFERYIEKSTKHSGDVKADRAVADAAYKDIVARINAQILLPERQRRICLLCKTQNALIERYRLVVAQHRGHTGKRSNCRNGDEKVSG